MKLCFLFLALHICAWAETINDALAQKCLKQYYPQIKEIIDNQVILYDGRTFVWNDNNDNIEKSYEEKLNAPDMRQSFEYRYPFNGNIQTPAQDSTRIRHLGFLKAIYGDNKEAVKANIVKLQWFPKQFTQSYIFVNSANGASEAFKRVMERLSNLPSSHYQFLSEQDAFYWRNIADSENLSPHSFGIALDINTKFSKYWLWDIKERNQYQYENQIPMEIVRAFEEEGFVWGGRWWHYDTMHFEYRPEIICYAKHYDD